MEDASGRKFELNFLFLKFGCRTILFYMLNAMKFACVLLC